MQGGLADGPGRVGKWATGVKLTFQTALGVHLVDLVQLSTLSPSRRLDHSPTGPLAVRRPSALSRRLVANYTSVIPPQHGITSYWQLLSGCGRFRATPRLLAKSTVARRNRSSSGLFR